MSTLSRILVLLNLCLCPFDLRAGDFLRPTAKIEREASRRIRMSITFTRLSASDLSSLEIQNNDLGKARDALIKYLDICVPTSEECGASQKKAKYFQNPNLDKTPLIDQSETITAEILANTLTLVKDLNLESYTLKADILLANLDPNDSFSLSTKISTKITYGSPATADSDTAIEVKNSLGVKQSPQESAIVSSKNSLTATWQELSTVTLSDGTSGYASGVLAVLVPVNYIQRGGTLPARTYSSDFASQVTESDTTCALSADVSNASASSCSITCGANGANAFLVSDDLTQLEAEGVAAKEISLNSGNAISFASLSPEQNYAIVLQYQPDGIGQSCVVGTPTDVITLVQLQTGKEPKLGDPSCFIATAAYGSSLDRHLTSLRWFRDQYLQAFSLGRRFISFYYQYGPHAAAYISDKPTLRAFVRFLLWGPTLFLDSVRAHSTFGPILVLFALGSVLVLSLGLFLSVTRRIKSIFS